MLAVLLAARAFAVGDAATELDGSWTVARVDRTGTSSGSCRRGLAWAIVLELEGAPETDLPTPWSHLQYLGLIRPSTPTNSSFPGRGA